MAKIILTQLIPLILLLPTALRAQFGALPSLRPAIYLNNATGSDTGVSGAPPTFGPFSASATCHTNGVDSNVIEWASNPLTGVPIDGSAALYLNADNIPFGPFTDAPTRLQVIRGWTANTVTVADYFNIPAGSPVDCAVGGKWKTLNQTLANNIRDEGVEYSGYDLVIEYTGTDYIINTTIDFKNAGTVNVCQYSGVVEIRGSGSQRPRIVTQTNTTTFRSFGASFRYLHFINTSATKTDSYALYIPARAVAPFQCAIRSMRQITDCIFGGSSVAEGFASCCRGDLDREGRINFIGNELRYSTIGFDGPVAFSSFIANYIHHNGIGVRGAPCTNYSGAHTIISIMHSVGFWYRNLIVNNSGVGIHVTCDIGEVYDPLTRRPRPIYPEEGCHDPTFEGLCGNVGTSGQYIENTIDGNGSHGIDFGTLSWAKVLVGNQITNNGGYGISCTPGTGGCEDPKAKALTLYNNFWKNTVGDTNSWVFDSTDTFVDPKYQGRAQGNWCVPASLANQGGPPGANLTISNSKTKSFLVRGACQPREGTYKYAY